MSSPVGERGARRNETTVSSFSRPFFRFSWATATHQALFIAELILRGLVFNLELPGVQPVLFWLVFSFAADSAGRRQLLASNFAKFRTDFLSFYGCFGQR